MRYKSIVAVQPTMSRILIERLDPQEVLNTSLTIDEDSKLEAPQGRILALGPTVDASLGLKIGDRVLLEGSYVPVPSYKNRKRQGIVEIHTIKAVLVEEE